MSATTTFSEKTKNPVFQAAIVLGLVLLSHIGIYLLSSMGAEFEQRLPWTASTSFVLFFAMFNAMLSLMSDDMDRYWTRSILSYIALALLAALLAWAFSSLTINEAGSYKWIYIVLTFGYLLFLSLVRIVRVIVEFAQREEWNHPRLRKKKKKNSF